MIWVEFVDEHDVQQGALRDEYPEEGLVNIFLERDIDAAPLLGGLLNVNLEGTMNMETVLLLEGLNDSCGLCGATASSSPNIRRGRTRKEGTKKMAAIKRIRIPGRGVRCHDGRGKFVKCPARLRGTGRTPRRRRSLLGGLGQVTNARGLLAQFQPQLVNGGLAAAGAWLSQSLGSRVAKMVNVPPISTTGNLLTLAVGVLLAGIVGKVTKKPQIGVALGTGAVAITILNFIGTMAPRTAGFGVLQAEAAPYYQRSAMPPLMQMQALPAGAASVPNLYTDVGVAAIV